MKITPRRRQAIQDRIAAATEGPWTLGGSKYVIRGPKDPGQSWGGDKPIITRVRANQEYRPGNYDEANADLMAHAREDLPDLLEDLEEVGKLLLECLETYETQQEVFKDSPVVLGSVNGSGIGHRTGFGRCFRTWAYGAISKSDFRAPKKDGM